MQSAPPNALHIAHIQRWQLLSQIVGHLSHPAPLSAWLLLSKGETLVAGVTSSTPGLSSLQQKPPHCISMESTL